MTRPVISSPPPTMELFSNGHLATAANRPTGRLRDRAVKPGDVAALPVFQPESRRQVSIQTDNQVVEGRADHRVRPDASQTPPPPTDILRRAENLGVLKEVQDTAASLVSEWKKDDPSEPQGHALKRPAIRYLALRLAESCLEHGEDDASVARWLGVRPNLIDRRRLPGLRDELRELENSPDSTVALGTYHAATAAGETSDAQGFVGSYLEQIQQVRTFGGRLLLLIKRHATADIPGVVRQLLVALRHDLEAATPSREPRWLAQVLQDLGHMHLTNTLVEQLGTLQAFMEGQQNQLQKHPLDMRALLSELVGLIEQGSAVPSQIERLADAAGLAEPGDRIQLMNGLRGILMAMPARLFNDPQQQILLVGCVQHCLDQAIEGEEAADDQHLPEQQP